MVEPTTSADPLRSLTGTQLEGLREILERLNAQPAWSWSLPVLLHERCWLRLSHVPLRNLNQVLPPDVNEDAPELASFRALVADGLDPLSAQQHCWQDFGMEDCCRALRQFWLSREQPGHDWTFQHYLELVSTYRTKVESGQPAIPMVVLPRRNKGEFHRLHWIADISPTMRHTCA